MGNPKRDDKRPWRNSTAFFVSVLGRQTVSYPKWNRLFSHTFPEWESQKNAGLIVGIIIPSEGACSVFADSVLVAGAAGVSARAFLSVCIGVVILSCLFAITYDGVFICAARFKGAGGKALEPEKVPARATHGCGEGYK